MKNIKRLLITLFMLLFLVIGCAVPNIENSYNSAIIYGTNRDSKIILFLHGCNGFHKDSISSWTKEWIDYFTGKGFLFFIPDSFADERPPASCFSPYPDKKKIYSIRLHQAEYAIKKLRIEYPNSKIFVWGHSEGGGVANMIDENVDGILTTGYQCGFRLTGRTEISEDVPLLAIIGTSDQYVRESLRLLKADSAHEFCELVFRSPRWAFTIIEGMGHNPLIYHPEVKEAVDSFFHLQKD